MTELERSIRRHLITLAKLDDTKRSFIRYGDLADKFHLPYSNEPERKDVADMLGNISEHEHNQGRPLLSVIVVNETLLPGRGFFKLARRLGKQRRQEDNDSFALRERTALFTFWEKNDDPDA